MRAFRLESFEAQAAIRDDVPVPALADNDVLVRIQASSVNPIDAFVAAGALKSMMEYRFPVTVGRDLAGIVEQLGPDVRRYRVGDEIFGWVNPPVLQVGTFAEYVALPADAFTTRRPAGVEIAQAAAVGLAGTTALAALAALAPQAGERVLVVGATGGVGSIFVQLAVMRGAEVIATAFRDDETFLRGLGVAETVARGGEVAALVRAGHPEGVAVLLDLVSRTATDFAANAAAVGIGGRAASALGAAGEGVPDGIATSNLHAAPELARLEELARLLEDGRVRIPIEQTYALERAGEALTDLQARHTQGKLAIAIA
jgi:NADPH:quinone reductase